MFQKRNNKQILALYKKCFSNNLTEKITNRKISIENNSDKNLNMVRKC